MIGEVTSTPLVLHDTKEFGMTCMNAQMRMNEWKMRVMRGVVIAMAVVSVDVVSLVVVDGVVYQDFDEMMMEGEMILPLMFWGFHVWSVLGGDGAGWYRAVVTPPCDDCYHGYPLAVNKQVNKSVHQFQLLLLFFLYLFLKESN